MTNISCKSFTHLRPILIRTCIQRPTAGANFATYEKIKLCVRHLHVHEEVQQKCVAVEEITNAAMLPTPDEQLDKSFLFVSALFQLMSSLHKEVAVRVVEKHLASTYVLPVRTSRMHYIDVCNATSLLIDGRWLREAQVQEENKAVRCASCEGMPRARSCTSQLREDFHRCLQRAAEPSKKRGVNFARSQLLGGVCGRTIRCKKASNSLSRMQQRIPNLKLKKSGCLRVRR